MPEITMIRQVLEAWSDALKHHGDWGDGDDLMMRAILAALAERAKPVTEEFIDKWVKKWMQDDADFIKRELTMMLREAGGAGKEAETPSHTAYGLAGMPDKGEDDE